MNSEGRSSQPAFMSAETLRSVQTNEQGLQCLRQQRYEDAIEKFGYALRTLNQVLSSQAFAEKEEEDEEGGEGISQGVDQHADQNMPGAHDMEDHDVSASNVEVASAPARNYNAPSSLARDLNDAHLELIRHQSLIYQTPISISRFAKLLLESTPCYSTVVEMSISVMFNFAVAHHLFAISGQTHNPEWVLNQAVALYELTHSLQLQEGIELSLEYTMGTICNLGHIHRLRGDVDKSSKCFQHLLSIFCFLQSQNSVEQQESGSGEFSPTMARTAAGTNDSSPASSLRKFLDMDVFYYSVSHLLLSDGAAAAA